MITLKNPATEASLRAKRGNLLQSGHQPNPAHTELINVTVKELSDCLPGRSLVRRPVALAKSGHSENGFERVQEPDYVE